MITVYVGIILAQLKKKAKEQLSFKPKKVKYSDLDKETRDVIKAIVRYINEQFFYFFRYIPISIALLVTMSSINLLNVFLFIFVLFLLWNNH